MSNNRTPVTPVTVADVQRAFGGISRTQVLRYDAELQPRRSETGVRIYDRARVDFLAGARAVAGAR